MASGSDWDISIKSISSQQNRRPVFALLHHPPIFIISNTHRPQPHAYKVKLVQHLARRNRRSRDSVGSKPIVDIGRIPRISTLDEAWNHNLGPQILASTPGNRNLRTRDVKLRGSTWVMDRQTLNADQIISGWDASREIECVCRFHVPSSAWEFWSVVEDLEPDLSGAGKCSGCGPGRSLGHVDRDGALMVDCDVAREGQRVAGFDGDGGCVSSSLSADVAD